MRLALALATLAVVTGCRGKRAKEIDAGPPPCAELGGVRAGQATFYDADGRGKCSFDPVAGEPVAAINAADFTEATACGACLEVEGPRGVVTVRVTDRCSGCGDGNLDLSRDAFARIAEPKRGRVPVRWRWVPCPIEGPLRYRFKEGSNPDWTALQVRNHRHGLASLEAQLADGTWRPLPRTDYNYFYTAKGLGPGPYTLRVTDVHGRAVVETGVAAGDAVERTGAVQLPPCTMPPR